MAIEDGFADKAGRTCVGGALNKKSTIKNKTFTNIKTHTFVEILDLEHYKIVVVEVVVA